MRIRRAVIDDAALIADVHVRSWQVGYRGQLPQQLLDSLNPTDRIPRWTATLEQAAWPRRGTLVVQDGHDLIGFADLRASEIGADADSAVVDADADSAVVGEIRSFYVLPDRWGEGVGRLLMTGAIAALAAAGYPSATLWVLDTNARAIRFYEALGWTADGGVKDDELAGAAIRDLRYRHSLR